VMFRDLPDRLQNQLMESLGPRFRRRPRLHPFEVMEMVHGLVESEDRALGWLMAMSAFGDDAPWLYEIGREVYDALRTDDHEKIAAAIARFERSLASIRHGRLGREMIGYPEMEVLVHDLGGVARHLFLGSETEESSRRKQSARRARIEAQSS